MGKSRESPKPYMVTLENIEYKIKLLCNTNIMENDTLYVTDHDMNIDKLEYEKFHNSYCKNILGISKKSSNANVLGELGRFPLPHLLWSNNLKYWSVWHKAVKIYCGFFFSTCNKNLSLVSKYRLPIV